jgi:hypothetical protein
MKELCYCNWIFCDQTGSSGLINPTFIKWAIQIDGFARKM